MLCKRCEGQPVARGIKFVKCIKCGRELFANIEYTPMCTTCCEVNDICEKCGEVLGVKKVMVQEFLGLFDIPHVERIIVKIEAEDIDSAYKKFSKYLKGRGFISVYDVMEVIPLSEEYETI